MLLLETTADSITTNEEFSSLLTKNVQFLTLFSVKNSDSVLRCYEINEETARELPMETENKHSKASLHSKPSAFWKLRLNT